MDVKTTIEKAVTSAGVGRFIKQVKEAGGGDINRAFLVETDEAHLFIKLNEGVPADFFEKEAMGLHELGKTEAVLVPEVLAYNSQKDLERFLVLSYIKSVRSDKTEEELGRRLAAMHHAEKPYYGLSYDNYIGTFKQENGKYASWHDYYRDKRLLPQIAVAQDKGFLSGRQAKRHIRLAESIGRWLPDRPRASVLHGDLWGGNWIAGEGGSPYLIDPAVLYGDCRMDLAMTALFGGFTDRFYRAYEEASGEPLDREIWPLYQLFYVYLHLNSFGCSYLPHAENIVERYIG
ncbi:MULTISPECIES: fructosamine kinase family protein [Bacillus]|uniref:fructosamine kinase family protein n=1 Tax=Bacillus TaxID=1386 RepID=UPI0004097A07|nr:MULTISPECIES: fructosamine kinase family protein [Bacillus]QHZ45123.1 fructosamine kinase family protein [Bacillus sp. NSP9.1]WFA05083.1 fructosamine kinase family protein [Bacillus sp. HSf4]